MAWHRDTNSLLLQDRTMNADCGAFRGLSDCGMVIRFLFSRIYPWQMGKPSDPVPVSLCRDSRDHVKFIAIAANIDDALCTDRSPADYYNCDPHPGSAF